MTRGRRPFDAQPKLSAHEIVVHRALAGERAVAVGVGEQHPPVRRTHHDHRERVADHPIAVEVGGRRRAERQLCDTAGIVGSVGVERLYAAEPAEPAGAHLHRVPRGLDPHERDNALARKVTQVDDLRTAGRRGEEARDARIHAGVQNADEYAPAVGFRMCPEKAVDASARQGHPAMRIGRVRRRDAADRIGDGCWCGRRPCARRLVRRCRPGAHGHAAVGAGWRGSGGLGSAGGAPRQRERGGDDGSGKKRRTHADPSGSRPRRAAEARRGRGAARRSWR